MQPGEPLLDLARGRALGRIVGEQLADQVAQGRAGIEAGAAELAVHRSGPARQQPDEQRAQAVEVGRAVGRQAAVGSRDRGRPRRAPASSPTRPGNRRRRR